MDQGIIRSLKAKYRSRMIQQIIKVMNANKSVPKVNTSNATKMLTVCWEDVTEETGRKCFAIARILHKEQANTQNDHWIKKRHGKIEISLRWWNSLRAYSRRICKFRWSHCCNVVYFILRFNPCNSTWSRGASQSRNYWGGWRWYDRSQW